MKFKIIVPYIIAGMGLSMNTSNNATAQVISESGSNNLTAKVTSHTVTSDLLALAEKADVHFFDVYNEEMLLDTKAENLCNVYMENMLDAQQRLAPYVGKSGYRTAVRKELPGAPIGFHCVYGQYTQLQRALDEMGDTLTIVPQYANRACDAFKTQMRKKYTHANGFDNCIFEGKMHESDSAYVVAMDKYLARNHATTDEAIIKYSTIFEQKNFSVDAIEPGAMLIVPRTRGNKRKFHMIMYVGRGRIENGQYVADPNGKPVFTAHNRERIGYLFDAWDTNNVFASNTQQIARIQYAQEFARVESMPRAQLIEYILKGNNSVTREQLNQMPTQMLQKMARDKYFKGVIPKFSPVDRNIMAQNNNMPINLMMQSKVNTL
ncbi:MAG: hypothetical protein NC311_00730 [Muribaculaceae bacterium]|nr:hypothetical protein [Muribaculaceae bacterium]